MKNIIYPAIFHKDEEKGFWVEFPDLSGCLTEGETLEEALIMAGDALFVYADGEETLPAPSNISEIRAEEGDFVSLVKAEPYESEEAVKFRAAMEVEKGLLARNLNQNQAAIILGVDRSYFSYIISGKKTPSPEMAKRIALLLNFDWRLFYSDHAG